MPGLDFELDDNGMLTLEQESDGGSVNVVTVHPVQLRFLCERAGLLKPQPINLAEHLTAGHVRRLLALRERTSALHGDERFFDQLFDLCPDGAAFWQDIRVIVEQVDELAAEFMEVKARAPRSGIGNDKSTAISVTPSEAPRRGRPPTGEAMSNAERQARYRERHAQQEIQLSNQPEKEQEQ